MYRDKGRRRGLQVHRTEASTLPCGGSERAFGISGYIASLNNLEVDENFFGTDPAHVHPLVLTLSSESSALFLRGGRWDLGLLRSNILDCEPGTTVKPATYFVRGLASVHTVASYRFVVEESRLDVDVSEVMDGGWWRTVRTTTTGLS